jgi:hypothetical protein
MVSRENLGQRSSQQERVGNTGRPLGRSEAPVAPWAPYFRDAVDWLQERDGFNRSRSEYESYVRVLWTKAYAVPKEDRPHD